MNEEHREGYPPDSSPVGFQEVYHAGGSAPCSRCFAVQTAAEGEEKSRGETEGHEDDQGNGHHRAEVDDLSYGNMPNDFGLGL